MEMKMNLENEKAYQEASISKEHYRAGIPTRKEGGKNEERNCHEKRGIQSVPCYQPL